MATSGADNGLHGGAAGILSDPRQSAGGGMSPAGALQQGGEVPKDDPKEEVLTKKRWKDFERARKFDENFRKQIAIDRRYAAGTSDLSWAVTTNLIGAFIDILVALLYAKDPDVSAKKAPQVDNSNTGTMDAFAATLEIVISKLWKKGNLKKAARKAVRSVLSNAEGWIKANLYAQKDPQPETDKAINDARETMARLEAQLKLLEDPQDKDPETIEAELEEKQALIDELDKKLELAVNKFLAIDFVRTERIQVSLDVESIEDYKDANWIADEQYLEEEDALERFPRLSAEDIKLAKKFYQMEPKELTTREMDNVLPQGTITAESSQAFTTASSDGQSPAFLRVVEMWDRRDKHIYTMIDGIHKWAKEPYTPPFPTSRFYPYFYFAFYEVDGQRHAQSLSWRLYKLQDEYSTTRSNFRLTRERSIPGVFFNAANLDSTEAKKITDAKHQEYTAVKPIDVDTPMANLFAAKPVAVIDPRLYDPTYILNDMERLSGVQEALSSAINGPGNPRTATEANIQQSGTAARTTSDRDSMEEMLTDLAQATAEQALQVFTVREVQRMAGPKAFWPGPDPEHGREEGMSIDDLFTLVEISLTAGSTGKPKQATDQQAWSTLLPLIKSTIMEIRQQLASGDMASANANIELIKETMKRLGDESDPERFIPRVPPPGSPGAGAPPPPVVPKVQIALKGEIDGNTAMQLVQPALKLDGVVPPPDATPGGGAPPGASPSAAAPMPPPGGAPTVSIGPTQ
jgi:hypothetical protein